MKNLFLIVTPDHNWNLVNANFVIFFTTVFMINTLGIQPKGRDYFYFVSM